MANVSNNQLLPAYLTVGDDELKRGVVAARLRARVGADSDLDLNSDKFDGEMVLGNDIVNAANTLPFLGDLRLIEVTHADKLRKADSEALVEYLKEPCPTTVMILDADKLAKTTRLYKAIAALGKSAVIECTVPKEAQLVGLVRDLAKGYGAPFSEGAARKLVALVGAKTVALDAEVKKVALAHTGASAVSEREVESLVVRKTEPKPWEFTDAFAARDLRKCLWCLQRMHGASPYQLLPQCANRVRELMCVQSLAARGQSRALEGEISAFRGRKMSSWQLKNHTTWARAWQPADLRRALRLARDAERQMKSGTDPDDAFLNWVLAVVPAKR